MAENTTLEQVQELMATQSSEHHRITEINMLLTTLSVSQANAINRIHASQKIKLTPLSLLYDIVEKGGMTTQTELAGRFPYTKQAMTLAIDSLVENGLVFRQVSESDHRVKHIIITDKGLDVVKKAFPLRSEFYDQFAKILSDEDFENLLTSLRKINRFYQTYE